MDGKLPNEFHSKKIKNNMSEEAEDENTENKDNFLCLVNDRQRGRQSLVSLERNLDERDVLVWTVG
eukprot:11083048-Ditylum_brightwellii.AAC.1